MSDHLDRAAEVIARSWVDISTLRAVGYDGMSAEERRYLTDKATALARALDRAGLLASPERDAAVAARALREAGESGADT